MFIRHWSLKMLAGDLRSDNEVKSLYLITRNQDTGCVRTCVVMSKQQAGLWEC